MISKLLHNSVSLALKMQSHQSTGNLVVASKFLLSVPPTTLLFPELVS